MSLLTLNYRVITGSILACLSLVAIGWTRLPTTGVAILIQTSLAMAAVPTQINHQGVVSVNGVRFNGMGGFRFALVPPSGVYAWTNDDSTTHTTNRPVNGVMLQVVNGVYSVRLGDSILPNMTAIPPARLNNDNLKLRVWFDDGQGHGIQQLAPDQPLSAAAYAVRSIGLVPIGSIVAWHKHMGNAPPLPDDTFVECNGQVLDDPDSQFNGRMLPNLNGERRFLRGGTDSGSIEADELRSHAHSGTTTDGAIPAPPCEVVPCFANVRSQAGNCGFHAYTWCGPPYNRDLLIDNTGGTETRPLNMSVVWIMRVK